MSSFTRHMKYKQDMPPPGGYADFDFRRTFPKTWASSYKLLGLFAVGATISTFAVWARRMRFWKMQLEEHDSKTALEPFLSAERDRMFLRWLLYVRDQENEAMEKVPGWRTGTWYGEPVYFTKGDKWFDPYIPEYFSHSRWTEFRAHTMFDDHDEWAGPKFYDEYLPKIVNDWFY